VLISDLCRIQLYRNTGIDLKQRATIDLLCTCP
jgi:hypothetical protein